MTVVKRRIVGHATPNQRPRTPDAADVLADLALLESITDRLIPEMRALGLNVLADSLRTEIESVRCIRRATQTRLLGTTGAPGDVVGP